MQPQWLVRGNAGPQTVAEGRLQSSQLQPVWAAEHPTVGYAPWTQQLHTQVPQTSPRQPLRGIWKEASAVAQRTARLAVLDTTRQALSDIQRAAKRGAEQGAQEANLSAVRKRVQSGAEAGTFSPEAREKLLKEIREGVHIGVSGTAATTPEYAFEEDAVLPMTVQGLPPETVRFEGRRCMSRCTDPGACHAERCTHGGAKPLTTIQGAALRVDKDRGLIHDIVPLLCPDWVTVATVEAEGCVQLCPQCHGYLMASLQLRSPNTLLVVR
jgi:hypothetical protein